MAETFVIASEADLWRLLAELLSATNSSSDAPQVRVSGWKPRLLYFPDEPIGHSLSPSLAKAVAGYHASLSRSYAYAVYGQADGRVLKTQDLEALDFRMLVLQGSNGLQVFDDALDRLTHGLLHKMSSKQMTLLVAIFLLLHFGQTAMKDWMHEEYAAKDHAVDEATSLALSQQETERMKIMASVLDRNPPLKPIASIADEGRVPLLRGTLAYERSNVLGTDITHQQAQTIVARERAKGISKRLDGRFEVVEIDTENPEGYMGTLRDMKTEQEIRVSINQGELPEADTQTLFNALREKSSVDALINAWVIGDKISFASVVRADPRKP